MDLKAAIRRSRLSKQGGNPDDVKAYMAEVAVTRVEELFEEVKGEVITELKKTGTAEVSEAMRKIKNGDKGDKGDSIVGPRGPAGKTIRGPQGKPGRDGKSIRGFKGKDGKDGKNGKDAKLKKSDLLELINTINGGIEIKTIKGLEAFLKNLQAAVRANKGGSYKKHGGGMTLVQGSNISLVRNSNGTWTISAAAGATITTEQVTATQVGDNAIINLAQLSHTFSGVEFVSLNGALLMPNGNAGLPTPTWSISGSTITVYNADATGLFLIQYTYA